MDSVFSEVPVSEPVTKGRPRIGLVLGAGGISGIAWLLGALEALQKHTGWDPRTAEVISGTSAGAVAAAVLASEVSSRSLLRFGDDQAALDDSIARAMVGRLGQSRGRAWPGSLVLGAVGLLSSSPRRRVSSLVGFLPRGRRSTDEIRGLVHDAVAGGWPTETRLWVHACDYRTGERVTFGRQGAPPAEFADAVVASSAVPGYYEPVAIGDRCYVDGGLRSFTNADALVDAGCDVVLILSPFATSARGPLIDTAVYGAARSATALQRRREVKLLRATGARVAVLEPTSADLRAMGLNPMDRSRSRDVLHTAAESMGPQLEQALSDIALPPAHEPQAHWAA